MIDASVKRFYCPNCNQNILAPYLITKCPTCGFDLLDVQYIITEDEKSGEYTVRMKVIKGLEVCADRKPGEYTCDKCPYETDGNDCEINLTKNALALLKKQESVKPKEDYELNELNMIFNVYYCGNCGEKITGKGKFCSSCGREVKWE